MTSCSNAIQGNAVVGVYDVHCSNILRVQFVQVSVGKYDTFLLLCVNCKYLYRSWHHLHKMMMIVKAIMDRQRVKDSGQTILEGNRSKQEYNSIKRPCMKPIQ